MKLIGGFLTVALLTMCMGLTGCGGGSMSSTDIWHTGGSSGGD